MLILDQPRLYVRTLVTLSMQWQVTSHVLSFMRQVVFEYSLQCLLIIILHHLRHVFVLLHVPCLQNLVRIHSLLSHNFLWVDLFPSEWHEFYYGVDVLVFLNLVFLHLNLELVVCALTSVENGLGEEFSAFVVFLRWFFWWCVEINHGGLVSQPLQPLLGKVKNAHSASNWALAVLQIWSERWLIWRIVGLETFSENILLLLRCLNLRA